MGNHSLLLGLFPTQALNPSLPHCRQILYHLSYRKLYMSLHCPDTHQRKFYQLNVTRNIKELVFHLEVKEELAFLIHLRGKEK